MMRILFTIFSFYNRHLTKSCHSIWIMLNFLFLKKKKILELIGINKKCNLWVIFLWKSILLVICVLKRFISNYIKIKNFIENKKIPRERRGLISLQLSVFYNQYLTKTCHSDKDESRWILFLKKNNNNKLLELIDNNKKF